VGEVETEVDAEAEAGIEVWAAEQRQKNGVVPYLVWSAPWWWWLRSEIIVGGCGFLGRQHTRQEPTATEAPARGTRV
jgi:hypothetical protein